MEEIRGHRECLIIFGIAFAATLLLSGCGIQDRLAYVGKPPAMTPIENPYQKKDFRPVSLPMPVQEMQPPANANALWQTGSRAFFKDQRATKVGDILTVLITISDEATMKNKTERARSGDETTGASHLLGLENKLGKVLPGAFDPTHLIGVNSDSNSTGDGKITRTEAIKLKLAAVITQELPNGNLVIQGTQEVRVNAELRQLALNGVIRPEDILNNNSISYEKIAEARISYGGKGEMSDIQTPRYGQQFIDAVMPF
jgi:flagellar L-ring protein precursor FlgH